MEDTLSGKMYRLFLVLMLAVFALPAAGAIAVAQDASPEAAGPSLLAGFGLPTLEVTVTADGIDAPTEIAAGPVLLVATNDTEGFSTVDLVQFPEGVTVDDYTALSDNDDGLLPEWTADAVVAGYAEVPPMATGSIVLNLAPGEWTIVADAEPDIAAPTAPLTVTGEAPAEVPIAADLDLEMGEYAFNFPDTVAAGPQIWHVTNVHTVPHHAIVFPVDRLYTADEVHDGFMAGFSGTPVADGFSIETSIVGPPVSVPVITGGQEIWIEADLAPGFYVAVCFVADPGADVPHFMQGMIDSFEVTDN
jgi:hypothetical protein